MSVEELQFQAHRADLERTVAALHRELAGQRAARAAQSSGQTTTRRRGRFAGLAQLVRSLRGARSSRLRA